MADHVKAVEKGEGWAVGSIDAMGEGFGFRKLRKELEVKEMGINAIVIPPRYNATQHSHERQEEVYIVLEGELEMTFPGDQVRLLGPGGVARVDATTIRRLRNVSDEPVTYVCVGAEGGYVGRDGQWHGDEPGFITDDA